MLIDTHCHIHFRAYKDDMDEVIKRTLDKGVFMITVGTQSDTSKSGLEVAEKYEGVWASVGLHPNHTCKQGFVDENETIKTRCEDFDINYYQKLSKHPKCVAIGETGLDYYHIPKDLDRNDVIENQKKIVRKHFNLATEVNLPVIVHTRDAFDDQYEIIKEYVDKGKLQRKGVVHCFTGTLEQAEKYLDLSFLISFTGILTFSKDLQNVVKKIPLESIMVETDAPYLTPEPHRGKRNEPWYVKFIAEKIAELKNTTVKEVEQITTTNAKRLFDI